MDECDQVDAWRVADCSASVRYFVQMTQLALPFF